MFVDEPADGVEPVAVPVAGLEHRGRWVEGAAGHEAPQSVDGVDEDAAQFLRRREFRFEVRVRVDAFLEPSRCGVYRL